MAALARANLAAFPLAEVLQTSFEDWQPPPHSYGLVYAAQSWHWVSPEARYVKADLVLRPGGTLALFWNIIARRGDESLDRDLAVAYGDLIPDGMWRTAAADRIEANSRVVDELDSSGLFGPVTVVREPWRTTYDTDAWLELLSTASDHRMLAEDGPGRPVRPDQERRRRQRRPRRGRVHVGRLSGPKPAPQRTEVIVKPASFVPVGVDVPLASWGFVPSGPSSTA